MDLSYSSMSFSHTITSIPLQDMQFQWAFEEVMAVCRETPTLNALVHHNVVNMIVTNISGFLGLKYESSYNELSGPKYQSKRDSIGSIMEEMISRSFVLHICDPDAWSGPLCLDIELHREATYIWHGFLRLPIQSVDFLNDLIQGHSLA